MDENDNRIVDFSYAGYKNGTVDLPEVPVSFTVDPIAGDNTAHIQEAIDEVSALPLNADGIRGAVLLTAGIYEIHGILQIRASGVILRGVGSGENPATNTVLRGIGNIPDERNLIEAGGLDEASWTGRVEGTTSVITSPFIPVGSRTLEVAAAEYYTEGDEVIIFHPSTNGWLSSINFGGTASDAGWSPGTIDIYYKRTISEVNLLTGKVVLDVPIYDHLNKDLATAEMYILNEPDIKTKIGIENLRIEIETNGEFTEDHVRTAIFLRGVEDAWVKDVTALNFAYAAVNMQVASRVTVRNCQGLQPHSLVDGGRRYNFVVNRNTNNILFEGCSASYGRHAFVSNGVSSSSGIVWHNCQSTNDLSTIEGHRRWTQALLFDQITCTNTEANRLMGLYNRGSFGTGHGWATVHSVAWNVDMPSTEKLVVQRPPGRQNYAIACQGQVNGQGPFSQPTGYIEDSGATPEIASIYQAQLENRVLYGAPTDAPGRFKAEGLVLSWLDIADDETGYVIEVSYNNEPFETLVALPANTTEYTLDPSVLEGNLPQFRLYASGVQCPSAFTHTITGDEVNSAQDWLREHIRIWPNPVSDWIYLEDNDQKISHIKIYDQKGVILQYLNRVEQVQVSNLSAGIYTLSLQLESGSLLSTQFIKR
jgi:hypothetical protein